MSSEESLERKEKSGIEKVLRPEIKHVIAVASGKGGAKIFHHSSSGCRSLQGRF